MVRSLPRRPRSGQRAGEVTQNPSSQAVALGNPVTFTAAASGFPVPTVQWQVLTVASSTWTNISGATSATYTFTPTKLQSGNQYRAVFTNSTGTVTTTAATLTVATGRPVTFNPAAQTVTTGLSATFMAIATGLADAHRPMAIEQQRYDLDQYQRRELRYLLVHHVGFDVRQSVPRRLYERRRFGHEWRSKADRELPARHQHEP